MDSDREDARADTSWLSYGELADVRGISRESAIRIVRRHGWVRRTGNDGTVRVAVPRSFLEAKRRDRPDIPADDPPDKSRTISALEGQIEALKGQMGAIEAHNAALREQAADLKAERDRALARIEELEKALEQARAVETSALHQSAWAGEDSSDAAEIEKLWQRVAELEHKHDEAGSLPQAMLEAITADLEQEGSVPAPASIEAPEPEVHTAPHVQPRRWWWRVLRRR